MFARLLSSIDTLLRRRKFERDMEQEFQHHIDSFVEDQVSRGSTRLQAEHHARRQFGAAQLLKEQCREARGLAWFDAFARDSDYALRMMRRSPVFTATAILSLALGIGANTAIFSILNALLLRPLPVPHPEELVILNTTDGGAATDGLSFRAIQELQKRSHSLSAVVTPGSDRPVAIGHDGEVSAGSDYEVSANFFSALGIRPALGRLLSSADDAPPGVRPAAVAVLGFQYWQREFHHASVLGKAIRIDAAEFIIVGVAEKKFVGTSVELSRDITTVIGALDLAVGHPDPRQLNFPLRAMGRLAPGVSIGQAHAEVKTLWPEILAATVPSDERQRTPYLTKQLDIQSGASGYSVMRMSMGLPLRVLMALSGVVLFIACVNLANLMLARAASRYREFGVRTAIGASPGTLIRQMLTESFLLSIAGAAAGFLLGIWTSRVLANLAWRGVGPLALDLSPDARVFAFAVAAALGTALLIGILPALKISRMDPAQALHSNLRLSGFRISRPARLLIVLQVAISLMLVTMAGLFAQSLENLQNRDFGFSRDHLLVTLKFPQPGRSSVEAVTYWRRLETTLAGMPEIADSAMTNFSLSPAEDRRAITLPGSSAAVTRAYTGMITPGYFRTVGLPLQRGREFSLHDDAHTPTVAVISQTLSRQLFPSGDSLGRRINVGRAAPLQNVEIVGIAQDTLTGPRAVAPAATLYLAAFQHGVGLPWLVVRTHADPRGAAAAVRTALNAGGQEYPFFVRTARELNAPRTEQMIAVLAGGFGLLALVLAAIGLYGVLSYGVTQRRIEIGIRLAVGATRRGVLRLILGEAGSLIGAGLLVGAALSLTAGRAVTSLLFGVPPADLVTLSAAVAILVGVGLGAAYLPARQASQLDPAVALRSD